MVVISSLTIDLQLYSESVRVLSFTTTINIHQQPVGKCDAADATSAMTQDD